MGWLEVAAIAAMLLGIAAAAFLVARRPEFWFGLGVVIFRAVLPVLARRMPPQEEAEWRAAERAGRGDEWLRNRFKKRGRDR